MGWGNDDWDWNEYENKNEMETGGGGGIITISFIQYFTYRRYTLPYQTVSHAVLIKVRIKSSVWRSGGMGTCLTMTPFLPEIPFLFIQVVFFFLFSTLLWISREYTVCRKKSFLL